MPLACPGMILASVARHCHCQLKLAGHLKDRARRPLVAPLLFGSARSLQRARARWVKVWPTGSRIRASAREPARVSQLHASARRCTLPGLCAHLPVPGGLRRGSCHCLPDLRLSAGLQEGHLRHSEARGGRIPPRGATDRPVISVPDSRVRENIDSSIRYKLGDMYTTIYVYVFPSRSSKLSSRSLRLGRVWSRRSLASSPVPAAAGQILAPKKAKKHTKNPHEIKNK
jgi:hypothetical protein